VWAAPAEPAPDAEKSTMQIDSLFKNLSKNCLDFALKKVQAGSKI
jgi:hypothetical protein